jgi:hypothetical protein
MKTTIEILIAPTGQIQIDAVGFKTPDCEQATTFLELALGTVNEKARKPEYDQGNRTKTQQRIKQ